MKTLEGKTAVVFGVASKRSIAWAIAQAWHEAGAKLIFNYQGERLKENVEDLASTFPAQAARQMGWGLVPMMCAREIPAPGSLRKVIRVLVHWNTETPQNEITHVYLREAVKLRPDLVAAQ